MRIAYVALHLEKKYVFGGVGRKVQEHMRIWNEMGHETKLFLLTPDEIDLPDAALFWFSGRGKFKPLWYFTREFSRSRNLMRLVQRVEEFKPDIIYLRFGMFTLPLQRIFEISPVVIEVNSNDVKENNLRGPIYSAYNLLTRKQIFSRASGMVTVTNELANLNIFTSFRKPIKVVSNGINLASIDPLPAPSNPIPHIALAGIPGQPWNGADKLVKLAYMLPDIHVDLIGFTKKDMEGISLSQNITLHGMVKYNQVRSLLLKADVACGHLAEHRKHTNENSPLKVREALAYGIPTILGYFDTDISNKGLDTILQLPNTESNVRDNWQAIHDFAYRMIGKRIDHALVSPLIDQRVKEEKRLAFFADILVQKQKKIFSANRG
jgi:glycosyltransferase involved in cell wall biosynthesis